METSGVVSVAVSAVTPVVFFRALTFHSAASFPLVSILAGSGLLVYAIGKQDRVMADGEDSGVPCTWALIPAVFVS